MKRQIHINAAAAIFAAARKLDTSPEHVRLLSLRSSGRSDGNIIVCLAANMDGAEVSLAGMTAR